MPAAIDAAFGGAASVPLDTLVNEMEAGNDEGDVDMDGNDGGEWAA